MAQVLSPTTRAACSVRACAQGALDNMNLFQIITIMSFFMLLPVSLMVEAAPILPQKLAALVSTAPRPPLAPRTQRLHPPLHLSWPPSARPGWMQRIDESRGVGANHACVVSLARRA